jgi:hypothetical protein
MRMLAIGLETAPAHQHTASSVLQPSCLLQVADASPNHLEAQAANTGAGQLESAAGRTSGAAAPAQLSPTRCEHLTECMSNRVQAS